MLRKEFKIIGCFFLIIIISCSNNSDFKNGVFEVLVNDSVSSYIERKGEFQLEYSAKNPDNYELFKIKWINKDKYIIEVLEKKAIDDSLARLPLIVTIDSVSKNSYYHTTLVDGIDFKFKGRIVKIRNQVSNKFKSKVKMFLEENQISN